MPKTIYIIGVGGRIGAMFARELREASDVVGVGKQNEIEGVAFGGVKVERGGKEPEVLEVKAVTPADFGQAVQDKYPDFIWVTVRNPVTEAVKTYYRYFAGKEKIPVLILSQNGLSAVEDAKAALREVLGQEAERAEIIRVSLINGVDAIFDSRVFHISYKLPIKLGFGLVGGSRPSEAINALAEIFKRAGFKATEFCGRDVAKMENSKLFTNLVGMAAAVNGLAADQGLRDKKIFRQEVLMMREYVKAVKAAGGGFVSSFCGYPIGFLAALMLMPFWLLNPFRGILADVVAKGRNRPKDLGEIDYYNGEVARLGRSCSVKTPVNDDLILSAKQLVSQLKR